MTPAKRAPKPSREEKKAQTRAKLLDAAASLFAQRGLAGASLDDVAEEAGLTKGAVYSNFKSKDDLIATLLYERLDTKNQALASFVDRQASPTEQAQQAGELFMRHFATERDTYLLAMEFSLHLARNADLRNEYNERFRKQRDTMAKLAQQGADEYGFALPIPAKDFIAGLFALGDGIVLAHLVNPEETPADLFGKMLALIFSGAQPAPSR